MNGMALIAEAVSHAFAGGDIEPRGAPGAANALAMWITAS